MFVKILYRFNIFVRNFISSIIECVTVIIEYDFLQRTKKYFKHEWDNIRNGTNHQSTGKGNSCNKIFFKKKARKKDPYDTKRN